MEKPNLTPSGVQEKLDALYALTDPVLQAEAASLGNDFKAWLRSHFTLQPHQEDFIDTKLSAEFIAYVSVRVPFALVHRLPITFTVPSSGPAPQDDEEGKIIKGSDQTEQNTEEEVSGHFEFVVSYAAPNN